MDYESKTDFMGPNGSSLITITGEDDTSRAPSPFPERGVADTITAFRFSSDVTSTAEINTNPLDEQQKQIVVQEESATRRLENMDQVASKKNYVFRAPSVKERLKEAVRRSLSGWVIGPGTTRQKISLRKRPFAKLFAAERYDTELLQGMPYELSTRCTSPNTERGLPSILLQAKTRVKRITNLSDRHIE